MGEWQDPSEVGVIMAKIRPLYIRLYNEPHLVALVRLIGYAGMPVPQAKERLKALSEQYGEAKLKAAVREVVRIDTAQDPPTARLTEPVRKLAWQLLGPPPKSAEVPLSKAEAS
jgi:hypothetical protein